MQRLGTLIEKLHEQYSKNADTEAMMMTAQMIVNELTRNKTTARQPDGSVTVLMPAQNMNARITAADDEITENVAAFEPSQEALSDEETATQKTVFVLQEDEPAIETNEADTHTPVEPGAAPVEPSAIKKPSDFVNAQQWLFDLQNEIPTLAQQPAPPKPADAGTLNEKLKKNQNELGNVLKNSPIKDLKKAIGINDRYRFINELFRGDESMFERSIKTINSFSVYGEAEVWIKRELKTKLGWDEESETTQLFDHLISRRFL